MRIFILPSSYPNKELPQKNIFIYEQAKQLAHMGHEVVILHIEKLPTKKILENTPKIVTKIDDGFAVRFTLKEKTFMEDRFPLVNRNSFCNNMEILFQEAVRNTGKPDILYAHFSCWAGYAGAKLSIKYNVPLVTLEHFGGLLKEKVKHSLKQGISYTRIHSNRFMCVSDNLKKAIQEFDGKNGKEIIVMPNMVDPSFSFSPHAIGKKFVISSIGNLNKGKDFPTLIRAFCEAFSSNENVFLRIGGGGPEESNLKRLINDLGRNNQITLLGRLTREQTINEYKTCDCFALASRFETYGIVYREALITGRPIVSTNHGGFSNLDWHEEYGVLTPVGDVSKFAEALRYVYLNIDQYDGKYISEMCLHDCSPSIIGKRIEDVLLSVVEEKRML